MNEALTKDTEAMLLLGECGSKGLSGGGPDVARSRHREAIDARIFTNKRTKSGGHVALVQLAVPQFREIGLTRIPTAVIA